MHSFPACKQPGVCLTVSINQPPATINLSKNVKFLARKWNEFFTSADWSHLSLLGTPKALFWEGVGVEGGGCLEGIRVDISYPLKYLFRYFASQTSGLCSACTSVLFGILHACVFMFCVLCLANTGFVQCFSLGPFWVCTFVCTFYYANFASQTSGLCRAFLSVHF